MESERQGRSGIYREDKKWNLLRGDSNLMGIEVESARMDRSETF